MGHSHNKVRQAITTPPPALSTLTYKNHDFTKPTKKSCVYRFYDVDLTGAKFGPFIPNESQKKLQAGKANPSWHGYVTCFNINQNITAETLNQTLNHYQNQVLADEPSKATLQAIVAHSLVKYCAKNRTQPGEQILSLLIQALDHPFFTGLDLPAMSLSLIRGMLPFHGNLNKTPLTPNALSLCTYLLTKLPVQTLESQGLDVLAFFVNKTLKNQMIEAVKTQPTLQTAITEQSLKEDNTAFSRIMNTRRHLFLTKRSPGETQSSKSLFTLFTRQPPETKNHSIELDARENKSYQ